ncbi:hypothetical protein QYE76_058051 [Lolium multiflorum]|uniref:Uncharacterized protein n=1 Tax=Lolium multiflorum TaxID=4521 RepID=A0AAD8WPH8_LOLMU|nr:hypothetical protein QYE76_058051 [Lolium multiflorum]
MPVLLRAGHVNDRQVLRSSLGAAHVHAIPLHPQLMDLDTGLVDQQNHEMEKPAAAMVLSPLGHAVTAGAASSLPW